MELGFLGFFLFFWRPGGADFRNKENDREANWRELKSSTKFDVGCS